MRLRCLRAIKLACFQRGIVGVTSEAAPHVLTADIGFQERGSATAAKDIPVDKEVAMSSRSSLLIALSAVAALILGVVSVGLVLLRPQPSLAASSGAPLRELTVVGSGTAHAMPDTVIVQLGVQTQAPNAQAALHDNNAKMQSLLARLKQLGIPDSAIQTNNLSLWSNPEGPNPEAITYHAGN